MRILISKHAKSQKVILHSEWNITFLYFNVFFYSLQGVVDRNFKTMTNVEFGFTLLNSTGPDESERRLSLMLFNSRDTGRRLDLESPCFQLMNKPNALWPHLRIVPFTRGMAPNS